MNNIDKLKQALSHDIINLTPVQWGEKNRVLSKKDSRFHGSLSFRLTPYLIKITNSFMSNRHAQIIAVMKGSQIGFSSACIYTILGWIIGESPSNTLFITENDAKLKDQMQGPINQMINSSGLSNKVGSVNTREREAKGRRKKATGDTLTGIDFGEGFLHTLSGQVISSLSSWNIKYGIYDEVERWKGNYKTAGDFMGLVEPRHKSYGNERKLLFGSTPEIKQTSNIEPLYEMGDQQRYMLPCKHCGEMINFIWHEEINGESAGIYYERESNGKFIEGSAKYICQNCGCVFDESHKFDMYEETYYAYKNGSELVCDWIPTAKPESYYHESYHISSLYAPSGFYSWNDLARKWCSIHPVGQPVKTSKLQSFYNQELGLTWELRGMQVETKQLMKNCRNYDICIVPTALSQQDGNGKIVLITCAVDLNGKMNDGRLDYEIIGWSESGSSYSIEHGSIGTFKRSKAVRSGQYEKYAKADNERVKWTYQHNHANNVWDEYERLIYSKVFDSDDGSRQYRIAFHGVDTGHFTHEAYAFVAKHSNMVSLKGKVDNKFTKYDTTKHYYTKSTQIDRLFLVDGDRIKNELNELIQIEWNEELGIEQPEGFMNYPQPNGDKYTYKSYFREYEGEKMEPEMNDLGTAIGFRWVKKHSDSQNHFWDCRVYNMCIKQIFTEMVCKAAKVPVSWVNFMKLFKK